MSGSLPIMTKLPMSSRGTPAACDTRRAGTMLHQCIIAPVVSCHRHLAWPLPKARICAPICVGSEPGSTRRVYQDDVDRINQIFGPSRYGVPPTMPPERQEAAASLLRALDSSTDWRQLLAMFPQVASLPQNYMHVLAMVRALARLAPGSAAAVEPGSEAQTSGFSPADVQEIQGLASVLLRASRPALDDRYGPPQAAALLTSFIELGIGPPENWLFAAELCFLRALHERGTQQHADAVLAAASGFQTCGHEPRQEFIRAVVSAAQAAWMAPLDGRSGRTASAATTAPSVEVVVPDAVLLSSGEEVQLEGGDIQVTQEDSEEEEEDVEAGIVELEDGSLARLVALPAVHLTAACRAVLMWGAEVSEQWLEQFLQVSYFGLEANMAAEAAGVTGGAASSAPAASPLLQRVYLEPAEMSDLLWCLVMSGARPEEEWLEAFQDASLVALRRSITAAQPAGAGPKPAARLAGSGPAGVGADTCAAIMSAIDSMQSFKLSADWVEAALESSALCLRQDVAPDLIGQLLFEVAKTGQQLSSTSRTSAVVLAQRVQLLMQAQQQQVAAATEQGQSEEESVVSPRGLVLLFIGLAKLGVLPELPPTWVQGWVTQAAGLRGRFEGPEVVGVLAAAAEAQVPLPPQLLYDLAGQLLEKDIAAATAAAASLGAPDRQRLRNLAAAAAAASGEEAEVEAEEMGAAELAEVLEGVAEQRCALPREWLNLLVRLVKVRQQDIGPRQALAVLQVAGMVAAEPELPWIQNLMQIFTKGGGLGTAEGVVLAAQALSSFGRRATESGLMQQVELASVPVCGQLGSSGQAGLLHAFAVCGHVPAGPWWRSMQRAGTSGSSEAGGQQGQEEGEEGAAVASSRELGELLTGYGALRFVAGQEKLQDAGGEAWCRDMQAQAMTRLMTLASSDSSSLADVQPLLAGFGALLQPLQPDACEAICRATARHAGSLLPGVITVCLDIFSLSSFTPDDSWLAVACATMQAGLQQQLVDPQDLATFMRAAATYQRPSTTPASPPSTPSTSSGSLPSTATTTTTTSKRMAGVASSRLLSPSGSSDSSTGTALAFVLLREVAAQGQYFSSQQAATVLHAAAELDLSEPCRSTRALEALVQAAGREPQALTPQEVAQTLGAVVDLGARPPNTWIKTLVERLVQGEAEQGSTPAVQVIGPEPPAGTARPAAAAGPPGPVLLAGRPSDLEALVRALDAWQYPAPELFGPLTSTLPHVATSAPATAVHILTCLANQHEWQPDASTVTQALSLLESALRAGQLPSSSHAGLIYSVARAQQAMLKQGQATTAPSSLPETIVQVSGASMAAYSADDLAAIYAALVSQRVPLPQSWLEAFWEYTLPGRCERDLLLGLITACASEAARELSAQPPVWWTGKVEALLVERALELSALYTSRVLGAFSRLGYRPAAATLELLLEAGVQRAQEEAEKRQRQQQQQQEQVRRPARQRLAAGAGAGTGAGAGARAGAGASAGQQAPQALGLASLLSAACVGLGFTVNAELSSRAGPLVAPVLRELEPGARKSLEAAFDSADSSQVVG